MALHAHSVDWFGDKTEANYDAWSWGDEDRTRSSTLKEKPFKAAPVSNSFMQWWNEDPKPTGSGAVKTAVESTEAYFDEEAHDRVLLLSKKYAVERLGFSKEDGARLEMLNQAMDLKFPRYSEKDKSVLDEAEQLLAEFEKLQGELR